MDLKLSIFDHLFSRDKGTKNCPKIDSPYNYWFWSLKVSFLDRIFAIFAWNRSAKQSFVPGFAHFITFPQ